MSQIQDVRVISGKNGCLRASFLAENLTTGIYGFFSIKLSMPDDGISYGTGTLKGRKPETQYNTDCNGKGVGLTKGDTVYNEQTMSITFGDDYNLIQDIDPTIARNVIESAFKGGSFKIGSEVWSIIGTNGVRNIGTKANDQDFKYIFLKDGEVVVPDEKEADGSMKTEFNSFVAPYTDNNMIMMEFLYAFNDNNRKGDRFVYLLGSECNFNEGSGADYNRYEISADRYSDTRSIDRYFIDGATNPEAPSTTVANVLYRVNADYVIEVAGGGAPSLAGSTDEVCAVINSDGAMTGTAIDIATGTVTGTGTAFLSELSIGSKLIVDGVTYIIKTLISDTSATIETSATVVGGGAPTTEPNTVRLFKYDTDWTTVPVASTVGEGTIIFSTKFDTDLNGGTLVEDEAFVVSIKEYTSAVNAKSNASGSGTATAKVDIYDWSYSGSMFIQYDGING